MQRDNERPSASTVAQDIRAGLTDGEIAEKYHLAPDEFDDLIRRLVSKGFVTRAELDHRAQGPLPEPEVLELAAEVQAGLSDPELLERFNLSDWELRQALEQAVEKNFVSREDIAAPSRAVDPRHAVRQVINGMGDAELKSAYNLDDRELYKLKARLLRDGFLAPDDFGLAHPSELESPQEDGSLQGSLTPVYSTRSPVDVAFAESLLHEAGIPFVILGNSDSTLRPLTTVWNPLTFAVPEERAEEASAMLAQLDQAPEEMGDTLPEGFDETGEDDHERDPGWSDAPVSRDSADVTHTQAPLEPTTLERPPPSGIEPEPYSLVWLKVVIFLLGAAALLFWLGIIDW
jgi:uncharacterized protein (DUF433 family)